MPTPMIELNDLQISILSEMANIGCNNALTALSKFLKKELKISEIKVINVALNQISQLLMSESKGKPFDLIVVAVISVVGDLKSELLIMYPKDTAVFLTNLIRKINMFPEFSQGYAKGGFDLKLLQKISEIISENYVETVRKFIGKFIDLNIKTSDSFMIVTYGRSIIEVILSTLGIDVRGNLLVKTDTNFQILGSEETECKFVFMLGMDSALRLLGKMERKISTA